MSFESILMPIREGSCKEEKYSLLIRTLPQLLSLSDHPVSTLSNAVAILHETLQTLWTGIYLVRGQELILFPFQGPVACTRIGKGKGVCGCSWEHDETMIVPDVNAFAGHIACSSQSQSEIVVPLHDPTGEVRGVLDIDSEQLNYFDTTDAHYLCKCVSIIEENINWDLLK